MTRKTSHRGLERRVKELEEETGRRKRVEAELRETNRRLKIAYEQAIVYARHLNEEIGERKQVEEALQESEERFRTVADFAYDWEYWIGLEGESVYVSPSCERITGYPQNQFQRNPRLIENISHPDDRKLIAGHLDLEMESKEALSLDFRIITRAGEERWLAHVCQPVYGKDGSLLGRRATNRDITKQKHAEEEREKVVKELQEALAKVKTLSGLLPICSSCKKIRDDQGYWTQLEAYIRDRSEADFSHSICPACRKKLYGDLKE